MSGAKESAQVFGDGLMADSIVIAGALAQQPHRGGHSWVFLQYLLGFRRLGWKVLFLDRLEPTMCVSGSGDPCTIEDSVNLKYLNDVMREFDLQDDFALAYDDGTRFFGLSRDHVLERVRESALFLNVMGYFADEEILGSAPRRVFVDIDPGYGQMWHELGLHDLFRGHDNYVSIGENIGRADCGIPTCGLDWITTPQPVVLEHWPVHPGSDQFPITSVMSWRGPFGPIDYRGTTYGLRVHEFRRFFSLPPLSGELFHLALDIHPAETADLAALAANGWILRDPAEAAGDPLLYQAFIRGSKAEFLVAKNMYVETRSGWISDRSLCYLASGKPVLAQDTGLADRYPIGKGLLTFSTVEEAQAGLREISGDYPRHARAARALAHEFFDSDIVLEQLLVGLENG